MTHPAPTTRRAFAALLRACAIIGALCTALPAHAAPFPVTTYSGTITHAMFVPESPFDVPVGPGTPFTLTISPGAPYRLVFTVQGRQFVAGQILTTSTEDRMVGSDEMTMIANNGNPAQTRAAYTMEVMLQGDAEALNGTDTPRFDRLTLRAFTLDATEHRGQALYQYELTAVITQQQEPLPLPGTLALLVAGCGAALAVRPRGRASARATPHQAS